SKHFLGRAMDIHVPGARAKDVAKWVWKNICPVCVGYYPNQQFVHVHTRDTDVPWIDHASHGESASARYFGRPATEQELPADAPMLAYDRAKQPRVDGNVEMAALQNILTNSFDPLQF